MTTAPHNGYDTTPEHVLFMVFALRERNGLPCKFDFSCVVGHCQVVGDDSVIRQ